MVDVRNMMGYKYKGGLETGRFSNVETYRSFVVANDVSEMVCWVEVFSEIAIYCLRLPFHSEVVAWDDKAIPCSTSKHDHSC